jgi:hypothetical protein
MKEYLGLTMRRLAGAVAAIVLAAQPASAAHGEFHYDTTNVDTAAHWAGRATLAHTLMFSGLGEPARVSMPERDIILKFAGYVVRPPMPDMAMVGAVYAAGDPTFTTTPDLNDPRTLRWDPASFDRRLDPEAQAWALIKTAAPQFHLSYHESREEKRIALMMLPQAAIQAVTLARRLRNADGLFATKAPDGTYATPRPRQQAAVLWAAASLVLAATGKGEDYWHKAARALLDPIAGEELADIAFGAVRSLAPKIAADRALAIAALGRYAIATDGKARRAQALSVARTHADALAETPNGETLEDLGFSIYGLMEASRLLAKPQYRQAAAARFDAKLVPLWDERLGAFRPPSGDVVYTPRTLAALVAALNAMRWYGPEATSRRAEEIYPRLLETALVKAGMLLSSPLPLVPQHYLDRVPAAHFAHPDLPAGESVRRAPVFAGEVRYTDGAWAVTDHIFRAADAMLLANMLADRRDGDADAFLPADHLAALER